MCTRSRNVTDDKINQALRTGGSDSPDVVSSFTTDNVGKFCSSGAMADLGPFLAKDKIDPAATFPKPMLDYTQYKGVRCSLPLLGRRVRAVLQQGRLPGRRDHRAAAAPGRSSRPTRSS